MAATADEFRRHIEILSGFEQKYGEFITAVHNDQIEDKPTWSAKQYAERKREIQMLATRADKAMDASGVGKWALTFPPAIGGGIKSRDLPSQVFEFGEVGFGGGDGLDFQRAILDRIPSQLAGLEMKLEEAEKADGGVGVPKRKRRLPTVVGRIRHVPPLIGFIADVGGFVVVVIFVGRFAGIW